MVSFKDIIRFEQKLWRREGKIEEALLIVKRYNFLRNVTIGMIQGWRGIYYRKKYQDLFNERSRSN